MSECPLAPTEHRIQLGFRISNGKLRVWAFFACNANKSRHTHFRWASKRLKQELIDERWITMRRWEQNNNKREKQELAINNSQKQCVSSQKMCMRVWVCVYAWTPFYLSLDLFGRLSILLSTYFATLYSPDWAISFVWLFDCISFHFFHSLTHPASQSVSQSFILCFVFLFCSSFFWLCLYLSIFRFSFIFIS